MTHGFLISRRHFITLGMEAAGIGALGMLAGRAKAEDSAPAAGPITGFYSVLLDTMKAAHRLPVKARYERLEPAVRATFDLAAMTRIAIGPTWTTLTADEQRDVAQQFSRLTIANYANRFDGFSGERFDVDSSVETRGQNRVVHSKLVLTQGDSVSLNYLMHDSGQGWKVIDVYLSGTISELATRRSEFGAILRNGGAGALIVSLRDRADALLAG